MRGSIGSTTLGMVTLLLCGCGNPLYQGQHPSTWYRDQVSSIPERVSSLERIAIKASDSRPSLIVERDHEGPTGTEVAAGTLAGIDVAGQIVSEDASGVILLPIVLPVAMIAGAIGGSMRAQIMKAQQESADELLSAERQPLPSKVMAGRVQAYFEEASVIDSVLIAPDATPPQAVDAVMIIEVQSLKIDIKGDNASMTITATAELRERDELGTMRDGIFAYTVNNGVEEWVENDTELWDEFVANALHYFATRISEDFFQKVRVRHVLRPIDTDTRSYSPTLAWELILLGGDNYAAWEAPIKAEDARYTLEIYQEDRLVYAAAHINSTRHTVQERLPGCKTYRWSVQPVYPHGQRSRAGAWMRERSFGLILSEANPQFAVPRNARKDFPRFRTPCEDRG